MRYRIPRPLHGWRAFSGEVGVIVLGVLIALGAQQLVEKWHMRAEVRAFEQTIDHEIALNLYVYHFRAKQTGCLDEQLNLLERWLAGAHSGQPVAALSPHGPANLSPYRSAWDNRNAAVFAALPSDKRQQYAEFYDELANNVRLGQMESEVWSELFPYRVPGPLSLDEQRSISRTLQRARGLQTSTQMNLALADQMAARSGIRAERPEMGREFDPHEPCVSPIVDR